MKYLTRWERPMVIGMKAYGSITGDFRKLMPRLAGEGVKLAGEHGVGNAKIGMDGVCFSRQCEFTIKPRKVMVGGWDGGADGGVAVAEQKKVGVDPWEAFCFPRTILPVDCEPSREHQSMEFVATDDDAYQLAVESFLLIASFYLGEKMEVQTQKDENAKKVFSQAIEVCRSVLGYKVERILEKVAE